MNVRPILLTTTMLAAAVAAADSADRMRECAAEKDDAARLACYDRAAAAATPAAETETVAMAVEGDAAASAADADARAAAEDDFGMNRELEQKRPDIQKEKEKELRELRAEVVEVSHRPGGEHIVTLENGQVWVEKTAVYGFRVKVGDTVTLKKGVFGGYKMVTRSRRSSQVRRVE